MNLNLDNIPNGVWLRKEGDTIILGSSRPPLSLINFYTLVIAFALISIIILPFATPFDWFKLGIGLFCCMGLGLGEGDSGQESVSLSSPSIKLLFF